MEVPEAELDSVPEEVAVDSEEELESSVEEGEPVVEAEPVVSVALVIAVPVIVPVTLSVVMVPVTLSVALEADSEAVLVTPPYADSKEDRRLAWAAVALAWRLA